MKLPRILVSLLATSALLFPAVAPAQTTADLNTQLVSTLQQLIVVLENEVQQLIAAHRASPTPPASNPAPVSPYTGSQSDGTLPPLGGFPNPPAGSNGSCAFNGAMYSNGAAASCTENPSDGFCPLGLPFSSWTCSNGQWMPSSGGNGGTNNSFSATPTSGAAPLNVTFSGSVAGTGFSINFGDGSVSPLSACAGGCPSSVAVNITHTYTSAGFYTVLLSNSSGATVGVETILVNTSPAGSPTSTTRGGSCTFQNTTYPNGGTTLCTENPIGGACPLGVPVSSWTCSNGQWVTSGGNGGTQQPFSASPTSGVAPLTVNFTGVGTGIQFGDGTGKAQSDGVALNQVTYTYASPGTYVATSGGSSVTITVSGGNPPTSCPFYTFPACNGGTYVPQQFQSNGCSIPAHYLCSTGNGLSASPTSGVAPLTVTFTGVGTGIDFGDGTGQAGSDGLIVSQASHTYTTAGTYTATNGGSSVTITVTAAVPNPSSCNSTSAPPIGGAACRAGNY